MWGTSPRNLHLLFGAPRRTGRCSWLRCGRSSHTQYLRCAICRRRLGKAPPHSRRKGVTCAPYSAQEGPNRDSPSHLPHRSDASRQAGWRPRTLATSAAVRSPPRSVAAAATVPRESCPRVNVEPPRLVHRLTSPSLPLWVLLAPHLKAFLFDAPRSNWVGTWYRGGAAPVPCRSGTGRAAVCRRLPRAPTPRLAFSCLLSCLISVPSDRGC